MNVQTLSFRRKSFFALILIFASLCFFFSAKKASAANFDLIQTPGDGRVFMVENFAKRHVKDYHTFLSWGMNPGMIRQVSRAEFDSYPTAPQLSTVMNYNGNVYAIIAGMKAHVASSEALVLNGFSWADLQTFADPTFGMIPLAPDLTVGSVKVVHIPSEGRLYYIENGYRRHIPSPDAWNNWRQFTGDFVNAEGAKSLPLAPPLTRVLNHEGHIFVIINGGKAHIQTAEALTLNGFSWGDMQTFADPTYWQMPTLPELTSPRIIGCPGGIYLARGGLKHHILNWDTYLNLGTQYTAISASACNSLPDGTAFGRLIQGPNGQVFLIQGNTRRYIPDPATFSAYGFRASDVRSVHQSVIDDIGPGAELSRMIATLDGITIPYVTGRTGKEQHIWTSANEGTIEGHYALTNVPAVGSSGINTQNGVAGTGAFGRISPSNEQWYITMRWNYCEWYEDYGTPDSYGYPTTRTRNCDTNLKNWHNGKKVIAKNPKNGRTAVLAVGESGPAIWVTNVRGVVSGFSPEATDYLVGPSYGTGGDILEYGWASDQSLPVGPINF